MIDDQITPDYIALHGLAGTVTIDDPITGTKRRMVFQRTSPQFANARSNQHERLQFRAEYGGRKGNTQQQQGQRSTFRNAVQAWQALTPAQKIEVQREKRKKGITLSNYAYFISQYMKSNPTPP